MKSCAHIAERHLKLGWTGLAVFICLGLALDGLLAFKVELYLLAQNASRRELWRLAHAHGTVLSILHVAFASTAPSLSLRVSKGASLSLSVALVAMPAGFFLGGISPTESTPGIGIWLVPLGGVSLLYGATLVAFGLFRNDG